MIEIEKKFYYNPEDLTKLLADAHYISTTILTDIVYDSADYALTTHDIWLRSRDGDLQLKTRYKGTGTRNTDQYYEWTGEDIRKKLKLSEVGTLEQAVEKAGYLPCAHYVTTRKKYKKDIFTIDIDEIDYGYRLGEVELMIEDGSQAEEAEKKILNFLKEYNLHNTTVIGKLLMYLKRFKPDHYNALKAAGFKNL